MRGLINILCSTSLVAMQLAAAAPAFAERQAPQARPSGGGGGNAAARPSGGGYSKPAGGGYSNPAGGGYAKPATKPAGGNYTKPATMPAKPNYPNASGQARPGTGANQGGTYNRPGNSNNVNNTRPGNNNNVNNTRPVGNNNNVNINNNNVNINNNVNVNNRYPVYRPPGGGYYRPPNGGYYGPPRPPYGGWRGGYYPPPRYYYNDGPSVGGVLFGVAVTASLLAILSAASQPDIVYVQGQVPPPLPVYVPPANTSGAPALINVDINAMASSARPSASVCLTEAARQIGATGGSEIRIAEIISVEPGNGGYRFRLTLVGVYPNETRNIPMYCRATNDKIIELTFG